MLLEQGSEGLRDWPACLQLLPARLILQCGEVLDAQLGDPRLLATIVVSSASVPWTISPNPIVVPLPPLSHQLLPTTTPPCSLFSAAGLWLLYAVLLSQTHPCPRAFTHAALPTGMLYLTAPLNLTEHGFSGTFPHSKQSSAHTSPKHKGQLVLNEPLRRSLPPHMLGRGWALSVSISYPGSQFPCL